MQIMDLQKIEKKMWQAQFKDGLFDLFYASMLMISGVQLLYYHFWITFLLLASIPIVIVGKLIITKPRLGTVRFGNERINKGLKANLILLTVFLTTLLIFYLSASPRYDINLDFSSVIIILIIVIFGVLAYFLEFYRFLVYGMMFAMGEFTIRNFGDETGAVLFYIFSGILLITGLYYLSKFMRENPIPKLEDTHAAENNSL